MITISEAYFCAECGKIEYSDTGNPFKGFDKGYDTLLLCNNCYDEAVEEYEANQLEINLNEDENN